MRRRKNDKRVLRSGNGRKPNSRNKRNARRLFSGRSNNNNFTAPDNHYSRGPQNRRAKKKGNGKLVYVMIIALVAFVIGAGIGVSLSLDDGSDDNSTEVHYKNVTKEMTVDLNDTEEVYFEKKVDDVDYNKKNDSQENDQYLVNNN